MLTASNLWDFNCFTSHHLRLRFPHLLLMKLMKPVALQTVHVRLILRPKPLNKTSTTLHRIAVAVVRYMFPEWSISISRQQWPVWWLIRQKLRPKTLNCYQNMPAFTTVQHVRLGPTHTTYTLRVGVIHSNLQHSWSMLTVTASQGMWMGIFTFLTSRRPADQ